MGSYFWGDFIGPHPKPWRKICWFKLQLWVCKPCQSTAFLNSFDRELCSAIHFSGNMLLAKSTSHLQRINGKKCFQICNIFPSFSVDLLCFPWKISTAKHSPVPLSHRTWAVSLTMGSLFNKPGDGCHPWNQSQQESENARLLGWYSLACAMYSGDGYTPWISQVPTLAV